MESFTQQTLDKFEDLLALQISQLPGLNSVDSQRKIEQIISFYREYGLSSSQQVFKLLQNSDIRREWNKVFAEQRSVEIANWIETYCQRNILDLICGDGKVGKELEKKSRNVIYCDRKHWKSFNDFRFINYSNLEKHILNQETGTVLLIAVLHHQQNPELLLDKAFGIAHKNVIIVENTVNEYHDRDLHRLFDEFANNALNQSEDSTPNNHKTISEWRDILELRGKIVHEDYKSNIPGVLLPHQLYVVNQR